MATTKNKKKAEAKKTSRVGASKAAKPVKVPAKAPAKPAAAKKSTGAKSAAKASLKKPASKRAAVSSKPKASGKVGQKPKVSQKASKPAASSANSKKAENRAKTPSAKIAGKTSNMKKTPEILKSKKDTKKTGARSEKLSAGVKKSEKEPALKAKSEKESSGKKAAKKSAVEVIVKLLKEKHTKRDEKTPQKEFQDLPRVKQGYRPSAGIYFSLEDVENFLSGKATSKGDEKSAASLVSGGAGRKRSAKKPDEPFVASVPKRALAPASIADILGFNPIEQSRTVFEEKDVPQKWKKYYKLLIEIKDRVLNGTSNKVDMVSSDNGELSHENSNQGMDVADIGSKNFERDMALNLMSAEQNIVSEVNAAIERMRNGTYGVCEVTGKPIPESRLLAIPFARCTIEGQRQKELESRRMKSGVKREQFGVDMQEDFSSGDLPEEEE